MLISITIERSRPRRPDAEEPDGTSSMLWNSMQAMRKHVEALTREVWGGFNLGSVLSPLVGWLRAEADVLEEESRSTVGEPEGLRLLRARRLTALLGLLQLLEVQSDRAAQRNAAMGADEFGIRADEFGIRVDEFGEPYRGPFRRMYP